MQPSDPLVIVVILNWNAAQRTVECARALYSQDYPNFRVLIVDNGSSDGSEQLIREALPDLEFIPTGRNLGYAGGNNMGIQRALAGSADYVLIVNPDVTVGRCTLRALVEAMLAEPKLAAVSPVVYWDRELATVWFGGSRISWWMAVGRHEYRVPQEDRIHESEWATGCCMLVSRECLWAAGLLDVDLFLYWEETDLCQRLKALGYLVAVCPRASAFHDVGGSVGRDSARNWYYFVRNAFYFFSRHAPKHGVPAWWVILVLYVRFLVLGVPWAIVSRDGTVMGRLLGCLDFARHRRGPSKAFP